MEQARDEKVTAQFTPKRPAASTITPPTRISTQTRPPVPVLSQTRTRGWVRQLGYRPEYATSRTRRRGYGPGKPAIAT